MFQPPPPQFFQPQRKKELPARVKGVLGMKAMGSFAAIILSAILLYTFSDSARWPMGMDSEVAHRFANYALLATVASLAELLGIAGTWNFKRWGVYLLVVCSTLGFMLRLRGGDKIGAFVSVGSTVLVGLAIGTRWNDFE
jgi:hypothetical protein